MRIRSAEFAACAVSAGGYPRDGLPEIVLIGRSNVGKSSLINALVNKKGLAKTSSAPGKTRTVNFYKLNSEFYLVDLPGFGYAKLPASVRREWARMIDEFIVGRKTVKGALVILDVRRDPTEAVDDLYSWIEGLGLPVVTVLTKIDKLSRNRLTKRAAIIKKGLSIDSCVLFSALNGEGKVHLMKSIEGILKGS
jgi:GTP-binding protein